MTNNNNSPAPAGEKTRALLLSAIVLVIVAGAIFVPVMAGDATGKCTTCSMLYDWWTGDFWWCMLEHGLMPCF
jgi:hypothetical protein